MATIFNESIQGVKLLIDAVRMLKRELKELTTESKKAAKDLKFETSDDFKNLDNEIKQVADATKQLISVEKEEAKLKKELVNLEKAQQQALQAKNRTNIQVRKEQERQLKNEKRLEASVKKLNDRYAQESRELTKLSREFKNLVLAGRGAEKETVALGNKVKRLRNRLVSADKATGDFRREVGNYKQALAGSLGTVGQFATGAGAIAAGVLLAGKAIGSAVNIIKGFEQSNANLQAVLGITRQEMAPLINQAKQLGATTSFSASQVSELQTELAKLGFPTSDIQAMAASTLDAANAMGSDLAAQAKLTGATLRAFGLSASETQRVNDVLAKSTSASALDFEKLNSSMATIAPVAASFGFSLEETTALLGELSNAGFDASSAATATRNILLNLADSNGKLAKSLKEPVKDLPSLVRGLEQLKSEGIDLGEALELTDKRSVAAFNTFLKGTDSVLALNETLQNAGGTAEQMANIQLNTLEGSIKILNSAWEGLVLSVSDNIDANGVLSLGVRSLSNLLSFLSGEVKEVKKVQAELTTENLRTLKGARESAKANEELANRYVELTEKVELNGDERQELNRITTDLISRFGESVAIINDETGALEINIAAVRKKILADKVLESETAKNLLTEKARLETQIELAGRAEDNLVNLAKTFSGTFSVTDGQINRLIQSARSGINTFDETLRNIRNSFAQTGEDTEQFENKLSAVEKTLIANATAVSRLNFNQKELNRINEEFKALGIDIDELLNEETKSFDGNTGSIKSNQKARRALMGLIEKQQEIVRKLQEQQKQARSEEEIARLTSEIKLAQLELKRLQALGAKPIIDIDKGFDELLESRRKRTEVAAAETTASRVKDLQESTGFDQEKLDEAIAAIDQETSLRVQNARERSSLLLQQANLSKNDLARIREEGEEAIRLIEKEALQKQFDLISEADQKKINQEEKTQAELEALRKQGIQNTLRGFQALIKAQQDASKEREKQIQEDLKKGEKNTKRLEKLAQDQAEGATENLAFEQRKQAALEAERQREIQKQKIQELQLTALKTFAANLENDPNTALPKTLSDISLLVAAIQALGQGFFHGTDSVGSTGSEAKFSNGKDGYVTRVQKGERIFTENQTNELDSLGANTRGKTIDLVKLGQQAKMNSFVQSNDNAFVIEKKMYQSNEQLIAEVQTVAKKLDELPGRMPFDELKMHKLMLWLEHTGKRGNKTFKDYYKG